MHAAAADLFLGVLWLAKERAQWAHRELSLNDFGLVIYLEDGFCDALSVWHQVCLVQQDLVSVDKLPQ